MSILPSAFFGGTLRLTAYAESKDLDEPTNPCSLISDLCSHQ